MLPRRSRRCRSCSLPPLADETPSLEENKSSIPGNVTGGDVSLDGNVAADADLGQVSLKQAAADAYYAAKFEGGSDARAMKAVRAYANSYPSVDKAGREIPIAERLQAGLEASLTEARVTGVGGNEVSALNTTAAAYPNGHLLIMTHSPQSKSYWCGPAAGRMILSFLAAGNSQYDGKKQVQTNIANSNHMRTEIDKATPWSKGRFRIGLNRWLYGTNGGWYVNRATPTTAQFRSALTFGVDSFHGIGVSTVEFKGGFHYNNHPDKLIGHWITGNGYGANVKTTTFMDPATSVWSGVQPTFTANTNNFVNRYLQSNGITW